MSPSDASPRGVRLHRFWVHIGGLSQHPPHKPRGQVWLNETPHGEGEAAQAAAELSMKTLAGTIQPLTAYLYGCPFGLSVVWSCFYQNASYGGRMLEFKDCSTLYRLTSVM